jgi:hypothetical protein
MYTTIAISSSRHSSPWLVDERVGRWGDGHHGIWGWVVGAIVLGRCKLSGNGATNV